MKKLGDILGQVEFHIFLFGLGLVLLSWPLTGVFHGRQPEIIVVYFFLVWIVLIVVLFLVSRSIRGSAPESVEERPKG